MINSILIGLTYIRLAFKWRHHQQRSIRTANNNRFAKPNHIFERLFLTPVFPLQDNVRRIHRIVKFKKEQTRSLRTKKAIRITKSNIIPLIEFSNSAQASKFTVLSKRNCSKTFWTVQLTLFNLQISV